MPEANASARLRLVGKARRPAAFHEALAAEEGLRQAKGERTRVRLMASGCELLQTTNVDSLMISRVSSQAGVAKGAFYIYFDSRSAFRLAPYAGQTAVLRRPAQPDHLPGRVRRRSGVAEVVEVSAAGGADKPATLRPIGCVRLRPGGPLTGRRTRRSDRASASPGRWYCGSHDYGAGAGRFQVE